MRMILFCCSVAETKELLLEKVKEMEGGDEKKGLRVNAGKTKIMWCGVSKGQAEDSESIHVVFAGRELATTQFMRGVS